MNDMKIKLNDIQIKGQLKIKQNQKTEQQEQILALCQLLMKIKKYILPKQICQLIYFIKDLISMYYFHLMIDLQQYQTINIFKPILAQIQYILSESMRKFQQHMINSLTKTFFIILLLTIMTNNQPLRKFFCHSDCISWVGACFDVTPNTCYVCAQSIYKDKDFTNPFNSCVPKDQRRILFKQLDSSGPLSLTGFSTSNSTPSTCNNLTFSGQYINSDYLYKNFTGINVQHFQLIIRFNVAYIGTWSESDKLQIQIHDGVSTAYYTWGYGCGSQSNGSLITDQTQNLCSSQGTDCVKIKQFVIQHNSSYVFVKWTALTSQTNRNVQNWGVKDLVIAAKTCHHYCDKCFGQSVTECLTCSPGFYLRGNTCVDRCPRLTVPSTQQCVDSCPMKFYHNILNNNCQPCLSGCNLCSGSSHCLLWDNQIQDEKNSLWYSKMQLWIIMMIAGVGIMGLVLWKFVIKKYLQKDGQQNSNQSNSPKDQKPKSSKSSNSEELNQFNNTHENIANQLWISDVENIDPVKVDIRRRKKRKADFNQTANNSQMQF